MSRNALFVTLLVAAIAVATAQYDVNNANCNGNCACRVSSRCAVTAPHPCPKEAPCTGLIEVLNYKLDADGVTRIDNAARSWTTRQNYGTYYMCEGSSLSFNYGSFHDVWDMKTGYNLRVCSFPDRTAANGNAIVTGNTYASPAVTPELVGDALGTSGAAFGAGDRTTVIGFNVCNKANPLWPRCREFFYSCSALNALNGNHCTVGMALKVKVVKCSAV